MSKKVFISYSWDSEEHQEWVVGLTNKLRSEFGIEAKCDAIMNVANLDIMMVQNIQLSDKIIVVVTKEYTKKANELKGGVGKETQLLYNYIFWNLEKVIAIKREKCDLPFYLGNSNYIDFSTGIMQSNLDALVLRINDEPPYQPSLINQNANAVKSKIVTGDEDLIPDFRVDSPKDEAKFLVEEFEKAHQRIANLLMQTKQNNPDFEYTVSKQTVKENNRYVYIGLPTTNEPQGEIICYTYSVTLREQHRKFKFWVNTENQQGMSGIMGREDSCFFGNEEFNSYNFWCSIDRSQKTLKLRGSMGLSGKDILTSNQLGEEVFKLIVGGLR